MLSDSMLYYYYNYRETLYYWETLEMLAYLNQFSIIYLHILQLHTTHIDYFIPIHFI